MITQALSWVLCIAGAFGLLRAGRGHRDGWVLSLALEPLWVWLAVAANAYGLIPGSLLYAWVYWQNYRRA